MPFWVVKRKELRRQQNYVPFQTKSMLGPYDMTPLTSF